MDLFPIDTRIRHMHGFSIQYGNIKELYDTRYIQHENGEKYSTLEEFERQHYASLIERMPLTADPWLDCQYLDEEANWRPCKEIYVVKSSKNPQFSPLPFQRNPPPIVHKRCPSLDLSSIPHMDNAIYLEFKTPAVESFSITRYRNNEYTVMKYKDSDIVCWSKKMDYEKLTQHLEYMLKLVSQSNNISEVKIDAPEYPTLIMPITLSWPSDITSVILSAVHSL